MLQGGLVQTTLPCRPTLLLHDGFFFILHWRIVPGKRLIIVSGLFNNPFRELFVAAVLLKMTPAYVGSSRGWDGRGRSFVLLDGPAETVFAP